MNNAQLIEEMRWQLKQIEDRRAENQRLIAACEHSTRMVTVLAGPGGRVSEVRLAPEAMRLDAGTLSRIITAAIQEAATGRAAAPRRPVAADDDEPYDTVYDV
ncbi:YbaB/EbfC family nucleoid-associated protein [Amycolatopsis sp. NPDC049691]|uniref:YbaB/EbfC family nucleoid-associated protein n=1 Tax=Amycolatopsis sp. NPDC049691 TaxID=3155155 RepID=UPI00342AB1FA